MTTNARAMLSTSNPYLVALWIATGVVLIAGFAMRDEALGDTNQFDRTPDVDPAALDLAHVMLGVGGVMLAGLLVASAVCWQIARRQPEA